MIGTSFGAFAARVFAAKGGAVAFLLALVFVYTAGTQAIAQTMTAPDITSEGPFLVDEGETAVATLTADDSDTATTDLIWTNTGGADSGKFSLTSEGVLTFIAAKDYEAPDDADADRTYEVTVQVSDGTETDSADLVVTLENVVELTAITGAESVTFPENSWSRVATFPAGECDAIDLGDRRSVWSGVMNPIALATTPPATGYNANIGGTLSDTQLAFDNETRTIERFEVLNVSADLILAFDQALTDRGNETLRLHLCGKALDISDATTNIDGVISWPGAGPDWSSETNVQAELSIPGSHPPRFASDSVDRDLAENSPSGAAVGDPVTAVDWDDDTLSYTLSGTYAAAFEIDPGTGQITTAPNAKFNFENTTALDVTVTATDPGGDSDTVEVIITVTNVPEPPTGLPTMVGIAQENRALYADLYYIEDPDGIDRNSFSYEWVRVEGNTDIPITGETSSKYVVTAADVGFTLKVITSFTDNGGTVERLTSAESDTVVAAMPSECPAPDLGGRIEVWSATLTPANIDTALGTIGYDAQQGTLSDTSFDVAGDETVIEQIYVNEYEDRLILAFDSDQALPEQGHRTLRLHLCGKSVPLAGGGLAIHHILRWSSLRLDWTAGTTVHLALSAPAANEATPPTLVSAETSTDGERITLTFSEDVTVHPIVYVVGDLFNARPGDFLRSIMNLTIDGHRDLLFSADISGATITYHVVTPAIRRPQVVKLAYNNIFARSLEGTIGGLIIDRAGNALALFDEITVGNNSTLPGGATTRTGPTLSTDALTIDEGGTATYTVRLPSQPTGPVGVTLNTIPDVISLQPQTLTFTVDDWDTPQTVTLTARSDTHSFVVWAVAVHTYSDLLPHIGRSSSFLRVVVENQDTPLVVSGGSTEPILYAENGTTDLATYSVTATTVTWAASGEDKDAFAIGSTGVLSFVSPPDFENPSDADGDNVYTVGIVAADGSATGLAFATVVVANVELPEFPSATTTRSVAENTAAGVGIGAPVTATTVGAAVTYTLAGTDAASFDIVEATGQLQTKAALDYETRSSYEVTVTATNSEGSVDIMVTIDVTNIIELQPLTGPATVDYEENRAVRVAAYSASSEADRELLTWSLSGADASKFDIGETTGVLTFQVPPNYERAADVASTDPVNGAGNNEYIVTVTATGGTGDRAMTTEQTITATVRNVEEAGTIRFSQGGTRIRAVLNDPDDGVSSATWQWARSSNRNTGWTNIGGATSDRYTPSSGDQGIYLQATVSYDDAHSSGKQAQGISASQIAPPDLRVATLVSGLSIPWDIAFTPDGTMLFTQRAGVLSSRLADGTVQTIDADFSDLFASGEIGLMGIVVDPSFASNQRFYTCQGHTGPEIQVITWTLNAAYTQATRVADPLVGGMPTSTSSGRHGGCRLRFGPEGYLWIATGDAASGTVPQDLTSLGGKVLRVDAYTGAGAPTNPFAPSRVYTYGHRNVQGLALRPGTSQMWSVEHGPSVDDEINLLVAGRNYGWNPVPGYNESVPMTDFVEYPDAVEAKWSSGSATLATSGGIFLEGNQWGVWEGRLAVATLADSKLRLFEFTPDGAFVSQVVVAELDGAFGRLRTPILGPDGALYVSTSNGGSSDRILRIAEDDPIPVTLKLTPSSINENGGVSTVTASLDRASSAVTTVTVSAMAVNPAMPGDFTLSMNKTLTITAGQTTSTGTVTITANNNTADTPNKTVRVSGTASNSHGVTDPDDEELTITDDDDPPKVTLDLMPTSIGENGGSTTVTASLDRASSAVTAVTVSATAVSDDFMLSANKTLTITAGQTSSTGTVRITANNNSVDAPDKTVMVTGTATNSAGVTGPSDVTLTIRDDDTTPAVTTCSGGMAGTYPCSNVDLMSFLALADIGGGEANDIWGWTDSSTGKEYAIMGRTNGTSFVDISDPVNPIYLGNLPPHATNSDFRDIKVYADHAFIVTGADNSGMQVFDLTQLRSVASPPATLSETAHYSGFSDAHNLAINEDSGFAYAVGTNTCSGGLHMIDLQTPTNPTSAGCFSADGYTHDAQCVNYDGPDLDHQGEEICFNSNEDTLTIVDVTNRAAPVQLSRTGYRGSRYTHQGWLTEDQAYFLLGDELDERDNPKVTNTRTYMWDVSDLDEPALIGSHDSTTTATDHNQYVKGSYTYQSNHQAGLRILDITDIANGNLSEAAFFDVYPGSDSPDFNGSWSNYPFFDSGIVIVSGIEQGLFILRPNLVDVVNPALSSASVNGATLTLTYGEALDPNSRPAANDFTVSGGNSARTVSNVAVSGRAVTLTLNPAVAHDETVTVSYRPGTRPIQDTAGNDARGWSSEAVTNETPDTTSPTVSRVEISSDPGSDRTYVAEDEIQVTVTFSEAVEVEGTPRLRLRVGIRTRTADYLRGGGTAALVFGYKVADGDEDTEGVSIEAGRIALNRGTIKDEADNNAVRVHGAVAPQAGHKVDGVRPAFLSAAMDGASLTLTYGEALDGGSRPATGDFTVQVDGAGRSVSGVSVSGSVVILTLNPAVEHGDTGIRVSYTPGTRPIQDTVGNDAVRLSNEQVTNNTGDTTAPTVSRVEITSRPERNATYAAGTEIAVTVTFNETVAVTGTPRLSLNVGGVNRPAAYRSGTGAAAVFVYMVADGESDTDGVSIDANSLTLNAGRIRDGSNNHALLTHDGLAANAGHKVDGVKPALAANGGAVVNGATLTLTYREALDPNSRPAASDFTVSGGNSARTVSNVAVSGQAVTLTLNSAVEHGETGIRVSYRPGTNPIQDAAGNDAVRLSNEQVTNNTGDTTAPTVSTVEISSDPGTDRTYAAGDEIRVTVTFSEPVDVERTPRLMLKVGDRNRPAGYLEGTGTTELVFGYEVADGDEDTDGVSVEAGRLTLNGGTIRDGSNNNAVLDHDGLAANSGHKVDGAGPDLAETGGAVVNGATLTLTYDEALDGSSTPVALAFTVTGGDTSRTVSNVAVSGQAVTLTLNSAVEHGETGIRVSYTPGTNPIQDAGGQRRGPTEQRTGNQQHGKRSR